MKPDGDDPAAGQPHQTRGRRPLRQLWTDTVADARACAQAELALARAETGRNLHRLRWSLARIGIGMLFLATAISMATIAAVLGLGKAIGTIPALLLLAVAYMLAGVLLVRSGDNGLSFGKLLPVNAIHRLARRLGPGNAGRTAAEGATPAEGGPDEARTKA